MCKTYIVAGPNPCNRNPPPAPRGKAHLAVSESLLLPWPNVNGSTRLWEHLNPVWLDVQGTGSGSATVETQGPGIVEVGSKQQTTKKLPISYTYIQTLKECKG